MFRQVWTDVNVELPPDRWTGRVRIRAAQRLLEKDCLVFQKKNPATAAENDFTYQNGIIEGQTGKRVTPPGVVTHWLKIVEV